MDSEIIINLSKTYILVATFSLNNADFPPLTPLSPRKPVSSRISVSPCKSVHNFLRNLFKNLLTYLTLNLFIIFLLVLGMNVSMFLETVQCVKLL